MKDNAVGTNLPVRWRLAGLIIPTVFIIISLLLNTAYRKSLFLMGVGEVAKMQRNGSSFLDVVQNIFSFLGNPIMVVLFLVFQLVLVKQRIRSLVHIIYVCGSFYYVAVIKQTLQETRPFWYSQDIYLKEWFCPVDFGNPSGHSFIVFMAYEPMISDLIGTGPKHFKLILWTIFCPLVMISRMYLGSHSLDQIIFGCLLGMAFLIIYKYQFQRMLYEAVGTVLSNRHGKLYTFLNTLIFIVFLLFPLIEHLINLDGRPVADGSVINLNSKCNKEVSSDSLKEKNLRGTALGCLGVGLIYGLIALKNHNGEDAYYLVGRWNYKSVGSILYLVGAMALLVGVPTAILAILIPNLIHIPVLQFVLICLSCVYAGFGLVFILSKVHNRYQWITYNRGDAPQSQ